MNVDDLPNDSKERESGDEEVELRKGGSVPHDISENVPSGVVEKKRGTNHFLVGVVAIVVGSIVSYFLFPGRILDQLAIDCGATSVDEGRVTSIERTGWSSGSRVGGDRNASNRNLERIVRIRFAFMAPNQRDYVSGICYCTQKVCAENSLRSGQNAQVKYLSDNPQVACVRHCRLLMFGYPSVLILILPAFGIWQLATHWLVRQKP